MNEKKIAQFANLIRARLAQLDAENLLGQDGQSVVALDQQSVGRLSRMDALQNQAMAKAQHNRRNGETTRLHAALHRIDADKFGYCDDCGEEIATRRLEVDFAAVKCISCAAG